VRRRLSLAALGFVVSLALFALLNVTVPLPTLKNDMSGGPYPARDIVDPLDYAHGLYKPETLPDGTTFRRSSGHVTLTFPYAALLGRHANLRLRLAALDGIPQPLLDVSVVVNGSHRAIFAVTTEFRDYDMPVDTELSPNPNLDPKHIQVDIESATTTSPGTTRVAGVAVDSIEVRAERSRTEVALEGLTWAVLVALVLWVALARLGMTWGLAFGGAALASFVILHITYLPRGISPIVELGLAGLGWLLAASLAPRKHPYWGFGLAACCLWMVVAGRVLGEWQLDDAYISYRYAWNLAHGHGLVYNPGEVVEGYTNFLWTIFSWLSIVAGQHPAGPALAANIALSQCLIALTWLISTRLSGNHFPWPLITAGLLTIDTALLTYGARGSGMEVVLFATLIMAAVALLWPGPRSKVESRRSNVEGRRTPDFGLWTLDFRLACSGLALALATLTRPEGFLVAAIFIVVRTWQDRSEGKRAWKLLLAMLTSYLLVVVPYEVWRISFYGYPFPNTFYAKTGATSELIERGLSHLSYFIGDDWLIVPLAALGVALAFTKWQRKGPLPALATLSLAYVSYIIWIGGDHFPGWRFFVPILAPLVLLAVEGARIGLSHLSYRSRIGQAAMTVALIALGFYIRETLRREDPREWLADRTKLHTTYVKRWGMAGLWLRDNTPEGASTAAKGAGAIAYYSQRTVIDVYGLNDLHIGHLDVANMGSGNPGHDKQDPAYVLLERKPDYILDEWLNYFEPVQKQLERSYVLEKSRSVIGPEITWWRRLDAASP
jgi:arabinofuranosyltransferase